MSDATENVDPNSATCDLCYTFQLQFEILQKKNEILKGRIAYQNLSQRSKNIENALIEAQFKEAQLTNQLEGYKSRLACETMACQAAKRKLAQESKIRKQTELSLAHLQDSNSKLMEFLNRCQVTSKETERFVRGDFDLGDLVKDHYELQQKVAQMEEELQKKQKIIADFEADQSDGNVEYKEENSVLREELGQVGG